MKLRINTSHYSQPAGGWGYSIPDGPVLSSDKVGEPGLKEIVAKLKLYRSTNGLSEGDVEHDIALHYAKNFPWLITELNEEDAADNDAESWIHRVWRSYPMQMAETRSRDERFEQCKKCVHFEPLNTDSLSKEATRRLMLMNPGKYRSEHGWCLLRGWIPSVAVQIMDPWKLADWTKKTPECWLDTEKKL